MARKRPKKVNKATTSPRFVNVGNFMRMERRSNSEGLDFAIYGIPFDTASSYRTGARFGPQAIRNISVMLKSIHPIYELDFKEILSGADLGDVNATPGFILQTYDAIKEFTTEILDNDAIPIAMGGDHSITLPELRAVAKKHGPVSLIQFDSHTDINDQVFGMKFTHGTPFRRAIEEGIIDPHRSIQVGMRGSLYDKNELKLAEELGFRTIPTYEVKKMGIPAVIEEIYERVGDSKAFLTFDIDFIDPAYAPATGTPEVGGYTSSEGLDFIRGLTDINFVGMDIVEVAPHYDVGEITALLAANIIFEFISILALQRKNK